MIWREGKNGLWSLSQPMKALVLCDSAVSKSGSKFCQMEKDETILKKALLHASGLTSSLNTVITN